jgi:hypothetical protein
MTDEDINSHKLCEKEYNFYKGFNHCQQKFNIKFKEIFYFDDLCSCDPYTNSYMVFLCNKRNNNISCSWDTVIHSYDFIDNVYKFTENIQEAIIESLIESAQKSLGLTSLYESRNSTQRPLLILQNFIKKFGNDSNTVNEFMNLCSQYNSIENVESLQKKVLYETYKIINNIIRAHSGIYQIYCSIRNDYEYISLLTYKATCLLIDDYYTLSFYDDIIDLKIHIQRYSRLKSIFIYKSNFDNYLYACLRRYRTVFWQYRVYYGNSMPKEIFDYWINIKGDDLIECFADPFNCYLKKYYSPFFDVDKAFGSMGSFFDNEPSAGDLVLAHPPTEKHFLNNTIFKIINSINKSTYILSLPIWKKYKRIKAINYVDKYPNFAVKTKTLTMVVSDLEYNLDVKKQYFYRTHIYIINAKEWYELEKLSNFYTEIFNNNEILPS